MTPCPPVWGFREPNHGARVISCPPRAAAAALASGSPAVRDARASLIPPPPSPPQHHPPPPPVAPSTPKLWTVDAQGVGGLLPLPDPAVSGD